MLVGTNDNTAAEFYDLQSSPEPKTVQQLIYEHLVHHCYSETAIEFGNHCKLNSEKTKASSDRDVVMEGESSSNGATSQSISTAANHFVSSEAVDRSEDDAHSDSMDLDSTEKHGPLPHSLALLDLRKKLSNMIQEGKG